MTWRTGDLHVGFRNLLRVALFTRLHVGEDGFGSNEQAPPVSETPEPRRNALTCSSLLTTNRLQMPQRPEREDICDFERE
jgi:hypothetical protein